MPFRRNPRFEQEVANEAPMRRFLGGVAKEAASEVESRLPYPNILGGIKVDSDSQVGDDGWEGIVNVRGHGYHLWEWGTSQHGARPAIRPGIQAALSRHGGKLGESRNR